METQKTPITKAVLRKKNGDGGNQPSWIQIILQNYSHQDSMVLAQKQKYRQMEQGRSPSRFSRSVVSDSATPWSTARQASLAVTNSQSLL